MKITFQTIIKLLFILATMVTPGDPLDRYDLKDKLGSG